MVDWILFYTTFVCVRRTHNINGSAFPRSKYTSKLLENKTITINIRPKPDGSETSRYRCIYGKSFVDWKQWPHSHKIAHAQHERASEKRDRTEIPYQKWKINEPMLNVPPSPHYQWHLCNLSNFIAIPKHKCTIATAIFHISHRMESTIVCVSMWCYSIVAENFQTFLDS